MPRLSFVVPVYKPKLDVLEKCVKSLTAQSIKDWEVVFVLDGENAAAASVIRSAMKKSKNHFKIVTQEHSGAQRARNYGTSLTKGDYVVCWDSDCFIDPETAQTWLDMFDKYPDIAFVYSGYRFAGDLGAIASEMFDPYTLRVRNYISTCFPCKREDLAPWNESLKSLQDWDFWLSVVEKGGKGRFLPGYAFTTMPSDNESISGQGCRDEVWLERVDAVKKLHGLPERDVCVSALNKKFEGVALAKLLGADYQDVPNWKPHRYKTIIQLGFSFLPHRVETHSGIFSEPGVKKIVFYTCDDVTEVVTRLNLNAVWKYSTLLNGGVRQFVEDKAAYDIMRKAGFEVEIMPLPMDTSGDVLPFPERARFAVDVDPGYREVMDTLKMSLPDIELVPLQGAHRLSDFSGLVHFHPDRTVSIGMKKAVLAGRPVVSNVQAPFMGFSDDTKDLAKFIPEAVERISDLCGKDMTEARKYYARQAGAQKLLEVIGG